MLIIGIIVALIIFTTIVVIHELGHFLAARFFGVKVEEFGIGIPPRAKKLFYDKKGTLYSLNWLPIGGFVRLKGENPEQLKNKDDGDALINKPAWQQAIIMLAGVFMNFVLAIAIFSSLFFFGVQPVGINNKIETNLELKLIPTYEQAIKSGMIVKNDGILLYPVEGSIAEKAGILEGDIVKEVNVETSIYRVGNIKELMEIIGNNAGNEISLNILRNDENIVIPITPLPLGEVEGGLGKIGAYLGENIEVNKDFEYKYGFLESIKYGSLETYNQGLLTFKALGILVQKIFNPKTPEERDEALKEIKGPIGMGDFISSSISAGIIFLLIIAATISINLGIFNLLPIPALDGGRFIFITINSVIKKIFGKKAINENTENIIHVLFFIILILLSILIAYNDILNIIDR